MKKIAITAGEVQDVNQKTASFLSQNGFEVCLLPAGVSEQARIDFLADCDGVLAGMERYDESVLAKLPKLKIIARRGVGVDAIDLDACARRGIAVTKSIGGVEQPVAELDFAFILQFSRHLPQLNQQMHQHQWAPILSDGVDGKTIGLIGFGGIGKNLAQKALAFNMKILYHTRHRDAVDTAYHATYVDLDTLLSQSDYVVLNIPLTESTYHLIDADAISRMKPSAVLVNTARGAVVDETALAKALKNGTIRGAACDVFDGEPTTTSPLMDCENAILTPHVGTFTYQAVLTMNTLAAQSIIDCFHPC